MTPLNELLLQREPVASSQLILQHKERLASTPEQSGAGAAAHQLVLDYFKLDAKASASSFG